MRKEYAERRREQIEAANHSDSQHGKTTAIVVCVYIPGEKDMWRYAPDD
jgi:hypothetical protein